MLFVCLGNICRSPAAEAVLRAKARAADVAVEIDSAGTANWHIGAPPYTPMIAAARARGYDLGPLQARQFVAADFAKFDLIIGMDDANIADIQALRPTGSATQMHRFTDYAPDAGYSGVPDPYYSRDFDGALRLIETAADGLLKTLRITA